MATEKTAETKKATAKKTTTVKESVKEVKAEEIKNETCDCKEECDCKDNCTCGNNFFKSLLDTKDTTDKYDKDDIEKNRIMATLCYLGPLVLIPFFTEKNSKFVKYHVIQGMNLFIIDIIYSIIMCIFQSITFNSTCSTTLWGYTTEYDCVKHIPGWILSPLYIVGAIIGVLCLMGVINTLQNKAKELPLINKIKIFK